MKPHPVFAEVQAALLNSDCDPHEAGAQGLAALYLFIATELDGSPMAQVIGEALRTLRKVEPSAAVMSATRHASRELRQLVLANDAASVAAERSRRDTIIGFQARAKTTKVKKP